MGRFSFTVMPQGEWNSSALWNILTNGDSHIDSRQSAQYPQNYGRLLMLYRWPQLPKASFSTDEMEKEYGTVKKTMLEQCYNLDKTLRLIIGGVSTEGIGFLLF